MKRIAAAAAAAGFALVLTAGSAMAYDIDASGNGFVGKGEVQLAFGWNNKQLQDKAGDVSFRLASTSSTAYSWTCDRDAGPQTNERSNTTTTTTQGLVDGVARDGKKQFTGFNLFGFDGPVTESEERDGPKAYECPSGWTAVDMVALPLGSSGQTLQVSMDETNWIDIP
jgi:hypothetical protein